jgi:subtilase family serine protease
LDEPSAVLTGNPALEPGWGGTSFVAPQFNGSTAVIDSYLGYRVGFLRPQGRSHGKDQSHDQSERVRASP